MRCHCRRPTLHRRLFALLALACSGIAAAALPGAAPFPADVSEAIDTAIAARDDDFIPRTQHVEDDGSPRFTNRLVLESSAYLQQHAHNPVNWYPWGEEAFAVAATEDKPVLLSVGYSTCHWCHVMEDESFDNVEIAAYLNQHYVAIKVDREERPDIDAIYMAAVQALTGRGGWPMNVWLTPDGQPFYGGSYFPPYDGDRGVREGFLTVLKSLHGVYSNNRDGVGEASQRLMTAVRARMIPPAGDTVPGTAEFDKAFTALHGSFDHENGGLARAPKFPSHLPSRFLLRYHRRSGDEDALMMAAHTLRRMAEGGLNDQVGGGFHRYATDGAWRVPHFEKMLYDNAQLTMAYLETFQATGDPFFEQVVRRTLGYVLRDMRAPGGGFYTASDADSLAPDGETEEGWFFTWTVAEIDAALPARDAAVIKALYDIDATGDLDGRNIPRVVRQPAELAAAFDMDVDELARLVEASRETLYRARQSRPAPFRDPKILTAWNGLMISAFARAGLVLDDDDYVAAARTAARFLLDELEIDGVLHRTWTDGAVSGTAFADDYAFLIQALLDLYEADGNIAWFAEAQRLERIFSAAFEDQEDGGFYYASADGERLLAREKHGYDRATPSPSAVATRNLLRLYEFTSDDDYRQRAVRTLEFFSSAVERLPAAAAEMLLALDFYHDQAREIVIVTANERGDAQPFLDILNATFLPNHVLAVVTDGEELDRHADYIPLLEGKRAMRGLTTAYVCEQGICDLPTADPALFAAQLGLDAP